MAPGAAGQDHAGRSMEPSSGTSGGAGHPMPPKPAQQLPREAYVSPEWFERERRLLFGRAWVCAGATRELEAAGDFTTVLAGDHPLMVVRGEDGMLRAFHNLCRHRGTELLEGSGRVERSRIVCPYHRWTYDLDGTLRAVPLRAQCFADLDTGNHPLLPAAVAELGGLVFVHPDPGADFAGWRDSVEGVVWPHRFDRMSAGPEVTYEIRCNWKVFIENAIDGYHLAYLHRRTLGGPRADRNVWDVHGRHLVWYSTETGRKTCLPEAIARSAVGSSARPIEGAESGEYGGVFFLFPSTVVTTSPGELSVSRLQGTAADTCRLSVRVWQRKRAGWERWLGEQDSEEDIKDMPGYDAASGVFRLAHLPGHPLETGDFHWEDVWVCEKLQRSLRSPNHRVGRLAAGPGAEAPLEVFQRNVLDFLTPDQSQMPAAADARPA